MKNRILTLLLALCMVLGMLCLPSLAAGSASGVTTPGGAVGGAGGVPTPGGAVGGAGASSGGGSSSIDPSAPMDPDLEDDETDPIYPGQLTGYCGSEGDGTNLTWTLKVDGTLVISGTGAMMDYGDKNAPWFARKASIKAVRIQSGVTTVGDCAFEGCENLATVTISNSVVTIGSNAFSTCVHLASVTIGNNVSSIGGRAFLNCVSLSTVTIGSGVTTVDDFAFSGCTNLTKVTIPAQVTAIGERVFSDCKSLTNIDVSENNTAYCDVDGVLFNKTKSDLLQYPGGKSGAYTVPDGVLTIGEYAFFRSDNLTAVILSDNVTAIGRNAFASCHNLSEVTIGNSVSSIGQWAFIKCQSLNKVEFLGDVPTSVGYHAFVNCSADLTICYHEGTTGWPTDGQWEGYPLVMIPDGCTAQLGAVGANSAQLNVTNNGGTASQIIVAFYSTQGQMLAAQVFDNVATGKSTLTITENRVDLTTVQWRVFFLNEQGAPASPAVTP